MCVRCCGMPDAAVSVALLCLPELIMRVCKRRAKLWYDLKFAGLVLKVLKLCWHRVEEETRRS